MARRTRRARFLRYNGPSSPVVTDITLWDHVLLLDALKNRPAVVLEQFERLGIWCLAELECFRRLWVMDKPKAEEIAVIAARMDIPINATRSEAHVDADA